MMKPLTHRLPHLVAAIALGAGLVACQTTPRANADLEAARDAVSRAGTEPNAARAAAVELDQAQQALRRAESAWFDRRDGDETQHLSYLALRRAETALAMTRQANAEDRLQHAGAERDRLRLEARTREADAAARSAQAARADAQSAQVQALSAQAQAQSAQVQAQSAQARAEQSRQQAEAAKAQLAEQTDRTAALERDLALLQARNTERGMVVTVGDVLFATGRAELQPGAYRRARQLAEVMRQYPERRVLVEGFTDSTGSESMNLALSQRRAEAFRLALLEAGVAPERVELRGHGQAYPVADNSTAAGRQQNRRVEVLFSDSQGRLASR